MSTYDVLIYEGDDLAAALTEPGIALIYVEDVLMMDAAKLSGTLSEFGVRHCIIPREGE